MATEINVKELLEERGNRYGDYTDVSSTSQKLKDVVRNTDNWDRMPMYQRESIDMLCNKLSRILNGDYRYQDSWVDIIGYVQLVLDQLNERRLDSLKEGIE